VAWQVVANHGGGYSYRLCAADGALDDDCFRSGALNFSATRTHTLRWSDGETAEAPATLAVDRRGAEWYRNPIPPRCLGAACAPDNVCKPCAEIPDPDDCTSCDNTPDPSFPPPCDEGDDAGRCSGNMDSRTNVVTVVDRVVVPATLAAGAYVLQWRWDCEATAQVWTNCADVRLE